MPFPGHPDPLAQRLAAYGYGPLLGPTPDPAAVESVRSEPDAGPRLRRILEDGDSSWQARFLASEFLFRHVDALLHGRVDRTLLQEVYFQALRGNVTGNGIDWGFEKGPDDLGVPGHAAVRWGGGDAFRRGLGDDGVVTSHFSWETPDHFSPPYRVKDFAALILARAHGIPADLSGSPADRDRAIAALARALGTR